MEIENEKYESAKFAAEKRFMSQDFISNVCLSYNHSFGLMTQQEKEKIMFECKEWMRSIINNWDYYKE